MNSPSSSTSPIGEVFGGFTAQAIDPRMTFDRKEGSHSGRALAVAVLLVISSACLVYALVFGEGSYFVGGALLALFLVVFVTLYRLDWGFNLFVFMVFFFDQYSYAAFRGFTADVGYFFNMNLITYLPKIDQAVMNPMELHLFFIFMVWLFLLAVRSSNMIHPVPLKYLALVFFSVIVGAIVYGLSRGGDLVVSIWETRAFFYFCIMIFLVPQIIQTRRQLVNLLWACIAGISFKAFQGGFRYAANGFSFGSWPNHIYETFTNHEDPVFFITLFMLLIGLLAFKSKSPQKKALLWLTFPLIIGFIAAQRRATYASFIATVIAFIIILPSEYRRKVGKFAFVGALLFGIYLAVFWNSYSRAAGVARQFRSTILDEPGVRGQKDVESTEYRKAENYNLAYTFKDFPLIGVGFGMPYERPLKPWGGVFPLSDYLPHNQILWVFVKTGLVGAFIFWFFFNSAVFYAGYVFVRLRDPYLKAICAVCVVAAINQFVVSFVDMQLAWYRNMIYLGILIALVPVLQRLDQEQLPAKSQ